MSYNQFVQCEDQNNKKIDRLKFNFGSKTIYLLKTIERHDFRVSLKIKSESHVLDGSTLIKAQRKADQIINDFRRRGKRESEVKVLIGDVIKEIIKWYAKQRDAKAYSQGAYFAMERGFNRLYEYWNGKFPHELTREEWDKFQDWHEVKYPGQDQFNVTKYARVLRRHLLERGLLTKVPTIKDRNAKFRREQRKKKKARVYTHEEILALDNACRNDRERLALRLGYMMAFRISDCMQLKWSRIHLDSDPPVISFVEGEDKADFFGKCPVPDDIVDILKRMKKEALSDWVFPSQRKRDKDLHSKPQVFPFSDIKKAAKINWGTFHGLRHYRMSEDFNNPAYTSAQVCAIRRISMQTALEHYIHTRKSDLELLRNAGSLKRFVENLQNEKTDK